MFGGGTAVFAKYIYNSNIEVYGLVVKAGMTR